MDLIQQINKSDIILYLNEFIKSYMGLWCEDFCFFLYFYLLLFISTRFFIYNYLFFPLSFSFVISHLLLYFCIK